MDKVRLGDGSYVQLGDVVHFKSDVEQCGRLKQIKSRQYGSGFDLVLTSEYGFHGDYIGGQNLTVESSEDCWSE